MSAVLARRPDGLFWVTGALKKPSHICLLAQLLVVPGSLCFSWKMTQRDLVTLSAWTVLSERETPLQTGFKRHQFAHPCELSSTQQMCWPVRIPPRPHVKGNSTASRREKSSQDEGCGFYGAFVCFSCLVPRCAISCTEKKRTFLEITFVFKLTLAKTISVTKGSSKVAGEPEGLSGLTTLRKS